MECQPIGLARTYCHGGVAYEGMVVGGCCWVTVNKISI